MGFIHSSTFTKIKMINNFNNIDEARKSIQQRKFRGLNPIILKRTHALKKGGLTDTTITNLLRVGGAVTNYTVQIVQFALEEIYKRENKEFLELKNYSRKTRQDMYLISYYMRASSLYLNLLKYADDLFEKMQDDCYTKAYMTHLNERHNKVLLICIKVNKKAIEAKAKLIEKGYKIN